MLGATDKNPGGRMSVLALGILRDLSFTAIGTLRVWAATVFVTLVVAILGIFGLCVPADAQELARHAWGRQIADEASLHALDSEDNLYVTTGRQETIPNGLYLFHYSLNKFDADGNLMWSRQYGREGSVSSGFVAATPDGTAYVAGNSKEAPGSVDEDVYVIKYRADGAQLWSREFGSGVNDTLLDVAVDDKGNAYLVGVTYGALEGQSFSGACDGFVVKYGPDGTRLWTRQFDSPDCDVARGVGVDSNGEVYVGGTFEGSLYDVSGSGAFLAKFSPTGTLTWIKKYDRSDNDLSREYLSVIDVEAGPGEGAYLIGQHFETQFIRKYGSDGTVLYTSYPYLGDCDSDFDIAPRPNGGFYYAASSDCENSFLATFNPDSTQQYVHEFGNLNQSDGANGIAANSEDYAYVAGYGHVFGDTGDGFLAKFNPGLELRPVQNPSQGTLEFTVTAPSRLDIGPDGNLTPNPFTVEAMVRNTGSSPVNNVSASFSSFDDLMADSNTKSVGTLGPGEEKTVRWQVQATAGSSEQTYSYDIDVEGEGVEPVRESKQIVVPAVQPEPDPDKSDDFGPCKDGNPACGGDPVNFVTGNVYDIRGDLNIPGEGLPLEFTRTYNSQDTIRGPLGYGWTHSYNASLKESANGSVTELAPDGRRLTFERNTDGSYFAPKGIEDRLTKIADGSYVLRKKGGYEWRFGQGGRLREIADPNANTLAFAHDADGNLTRITDSAGRDTTLEYDALDRIVKITDPARRAVRYGYDAGGDLRTVTDPAGNVTRYTYDADHNVTTISEADGASVSFAYDNQDRATSSSGEGGVYGMTLDYRPAEGRTLVTDSKGNTSEYHYDQDEQVTKIVDPYGKEISHTWDARGNKTSTTDQLGNTTQMEYDAAGNMTKVIEPKPTSTATTTFTYEPRFDKIESVTDPEGGVTRYAYDERGNLTSVTDALGNRTTFEYDVSGRLVETTDPKGNASVEAGDGVTTLDYDAAGNLTATTDPAGKTTRYAYGAPDSVESVLSLPASVTDPLGRTTDLAHDALGRTRRVTNPLTPPDAARTLVSMAYDATGDLTGYTDERGNTWRAAHDPYGRGVTSETDPLGKTTTYAYDTEGNLVSEADPAGNTTTYSYDKLTRLTGVASPDGTTNADGTPGAATTSYGYDAAGRMTNTTDPGGQTTRFILDSLGRLTATRDLRADGTTIAEASYEYDLLGRMTKATNPNNHATSYAYDGLGQLVKETDPLNNATSYTYDPNGNTKIRTDAMNRTTTYAYDPLDRLLTTSYPNGSSVRMGYDAVGNPTSAADETGSYSFAYDERDRLVQETFPGNRVLKHEYDAAGNRTALVDPDSKRTLYSYDAADRMTSLTDRAGAKTTYAYDALGRPTGLSYSSGTGDSYAYDPLGRMTSATATGANNAVLAKLTYSYDKNSNPASITDKAGKKSTFTYDTLDRLIKETHPNLTLTYAYDAAGNRKTMKKGTATTAYTYDAAERMTKAGTTTFAYDKMGNMTSRAVGTTTTSYAYDFEGMMTRAGARTYQRDPFGRAVSSTTGTATTDYLFDGAEVIQEKTGTAAPTYYTRGLDDRVVNRRAGTAAPSYYHHDAIGSVVGLSGGATLTDSYSYDAFGNQRARTGTNPQPFQYLGNSYDSTAKLYDFHARAYDLAVGRFTSKDPISGVGSVPQTLNPYPCSVNNPLAHPDPSGLFPANVSGYGGSGSGGYYLNERAEKLPNTGGPGGEPCESAGPGGSWEQYGMDLNEYAGDTNRVIPGMFAPAGLSLFTGGTVAKAVEGKTLFQWARSGFGPSVIKGVSYSRWSTAGIVGGTTAINLAFVATAYQAGVVTGSGVSAIPIYGEPCTNIAEWWGNYFYELGNNEQFRGEV